MVRLFSGDTETLEAEAAARTSKPTIILGEAEDVGAACIQSLSVEAC